LLRNVQPVNFSSKINLGESTISSSSSSSITALSSDDGVHLQSKPTSRLFDENQRDGINNRLKGSKWNSFWKAASNKRPRAFVIGMLA
jgi:hypothetical protein